MIRYFLLLSLLISEVNAQKSFDPLLVTDEELEQSIWVDSIYSSMTLKEKVGQLFVIQAFSNKNKNHKDNIINIIRNNNIGGIIFSKGSAHKQVDLTNDFQSESSVPLL